ncbi:hypothetical protein [Duganella qianjiadongensis]|uniref:XRE family transcriptional regulator n=1 Tax=Duganella qianjiadongensis TaxID=2692176 RepID=A0ABW9VNA5_9BURK|nr:hypothetical protein [Duganella qianjiadongensis]MYM40916.1 hypothetical protein [Duganella qianjiadongensis]
MKTVTNISNESIAELIIRRQMELGKSDEQISQALGFERVTTFVMIKQGNTKLPVQKVVALATALSIEPAPLLRQLLAESMPDILGAVDKILAPTSFTVNEIKLVQTYRQLCTGRDVNLIFVDSNCIHRCVESLSTEYLD